MAKTSAECTPTAGPPRSNEPQKNPKQGKAVRLGFVITDPSVRASESVRVD